ncbi:MAG: hypothetical protein C0594_15705 [Marinilabiliales bacterium]|nr:MAG: hypothetical protein C0594_15705 [Marinilabiliales bacterium]
MKKIVFCLAISMMALFSIAKLHAQAILKTNQIIVVNGGMWEGSEPYSDYSTIVAIDPDTYTANVFDTIYTQSVFNVHIYDGIAYVSAGDSLISYDLDTYERLNSTSIPGINQLAIWNDLLVVTKQFGTTDNIYATVLNKSDFTTAFEVPEISDESFGITFIQDSAYISVPGGWAATEGKLAVIDLSNESFVREISLDTLGRGMRQIFNYNNTIYSLNSQYYGASYGCLNTIDAETMDTTQTILDVIVGNGFLWNGFSLNGDYLHCILNNSIGTIDITNKSVADSSIISPAGTIASVAYDYINEKYYFCTTDYFSYGTGFVYSDTGDSITSFPLGISPEAMAIDYRIEAGTNAKRFINDQFSIYPNPANSITYIDCDADRIDIYSTQGRLVLSQNMYKKGSPLNITNLPAGIYLVTCWSDHITKYAKLIVE